MKTTLCVDDLRIQTIIGCDDEEQSILRELVVSLRLKGNIEKAIISDRLEDTVDYIRVTHDVLAYAAQASNHLLEHVARDIIGICFEYDQVDHVWVSVRKGYLPMDFAAVGIEMEMTR